MRKIIWAAEAVEQYKRTLLFWKEHNKSNAYSLKIRRTTEKQLQYLLDNPKMGVRVNETQGVRRILVLRKFSVFYKFEDSTITILSFWDNSRKLRY